MQTEIPYIDYSNFQTDLNNQFGPGIFTLIIGDNPANQKFYLEYNNATQAQVDQAMAMANQNALTLLNAIKVRLYENFNSYANKAIALKTKPNFTQDEIDAAYNWLQNQSLPCPSTVQFLALSKSITQVEAAQEIVNANAEYENFINTVNTIKTTGQTNTFATTDFMSCKNTATIYLEQLKNLY